MVFLLRMTTAAGNSCIGMFYWSIPGNPAKSLRLDPFPNWSIPLRVMEGDPFVFDSKLRKNR